MRKVTVLTALLLCLSQAVWAGPKTFDEAKSQAAEQGSLLLVDFYAVWCGPCKAFDKNLETDAALQQSLESVVFLKVDAEKGDGIDLAKQFGVQSYPTFVLMNSEGEVVDRWLGYAGPEDFVKTLEVAAADPTTFEQKKARFADNPTAEDAGKLAGIYVGLMEIEKGLNLYRKAFELGGSVDHALLAFHTAMQGHRNDTLTLRDVIDTGDTVLQAEGRNAEHVLQVVLTLRDVALANDRLELYTPHIEDALSISADVTEGWVPKARKDYLLVDQAMFLEKDMDKAVALKRANMPEGWKDSARYLNAFAWWCFENEINLDEAFQLAMRGVELAEPGSERGNILDTAAEICNLQENCAQAVELMQQAVAEDPTREYYKKQLARFEERVAMLSGEK